MADREKYLAFAAHCMKMANRTTEPAERLRLLEMAKVWTEFAPYAEEITRLVEGRHKFLIPSSTPLKFEEFVGIDLKTVKNWLRDNIALLTSEDGK